MARNYWRENRSMFRSRENGGFGYETATRLANNHQDAAKMSHGTSFRKQALKDNAMAQMTKLAMRNGTPTFGRTDGKSHDERRRDIRTAFGLANG